MFDLEDFHTTPEENRSGATLEEGDAALIANLVSTITHDLKNYIATIRIRGDILQINPDRFTAVELWTEIKPAVIQLDETLMSAREIVRWMRTDVSQLCREIDLNQILTQCLSAFQKRIKDKNYDLTFKNSESPLTILAVETAIKQAIIMPLIDNLVKFSFPGSKIIIQADKQDSFARIRFAGPGYEVPDETINAMFTSIEREGIRKKGTAKESGLGFSLFLANHIIKKYNGKIKFSSVKQAEIEIPEEDKEIETRSGAINIITLNLPLAEQ